MMQILSKEPFDLLRIKIADINARSFKFLLYLDYIPGNLAGLLSLNTLYTFSTISSTLGLLK